MGQLASAQKAPRIWRGNRLNRYLCAREYQHIALAVAPASASLEALHSQPAPLNCLFVDIHYFNHVMWLISLIFVSNMYLCEGHVKFG